MSTMWRKLAVALGAVVMMSVGAGVAVTAQSADANSGGGSRGASPARGAASPTETTFVPMVPCRIYSSVTGGRFLPNETRTIDKTGDLTAQGGDPAGCGIPAAATALEVNVTAASASGTGYIRVWPEEAAERRATFMNFTRAFNVSNAGAVDVDKGATDVLDLKVYGAGTHVIIDVLGYYVEGLFAAVAADGTLVRGNGVVSSTQLEMGQYEVVFDRDVTGCGFTATLDNTSHEGEVVTDTRASLPVGVFVQTHGSGGLSAAKGFYLAVDC